MEPEAFYAASPTDVVYRVRGTYSEDTRTLAEGYREATQDEIDDFDPEETIDA